MANTITDLVPKFYAALDVVSRELTGFIPAVSRNSSLERAALNQSILVPVTPAAATATSSPGVTAPDTGNQTISNVPVSISKSKHVAIRWNGEETKGLLNAGSFGDIFQNQIAQGMRALVNEMEADLWAEAFKHASRSFGTPTTVPFTTAGSLADAAGVRRILDDNGAPQGDLQLVLGAAAMANLRGVQNVLFKVNEAGTDDLLRNGIIGRLQGFDLHNSNAVSTFTKGTGAGYLVDLVAGYAVGDTTIHVDTGTGTILAGDFVTFTGDTNKYVVVSGFAGDGDGDITIGAPGLRQTLANDVAMTIGDTATQNVAFSRSAIYLINRMPAMPEGGDSADDAVIVADPVSGLAFEIARYRQYMQVHYQVRCAWGVAAVKQNHIANLLG
jgi:hypothetical protein